MERYGKRAYVRQSWGQLESAMLDLLKDKLYMHSDAPRSAMKDLEPPTEDNSDDEVNDPAPSLIDHESNDEDDDPPQLTIGRL